MTRAHRTAEIELGPHRFGETVNLSVLAGNERLCVASVEGVHELRSVGAVGQRSPLHSGAAARAILRHDHGPGSVVGDRVGDSQDRLRHYHRRANPWGDLGRGARAGRLR